MKNRIVIGLDPGVSTGMSMVLHPDSWRFNPSEVSLLSTRVTTIYSAIFDLIDEGAVRADHLGVQLVVVMEDFVGSGPRNADIVRSIKMCGWIEGLCEQGGFELVTQTSIQMGPFTKMATEMIADASMAHSPHKVSALAHTLCYLERRYR